MFYTDSDISISCKQYCSRRIALADSGQTNCAGCRTYFIKTDSQELQLVSALIADSLGLCAVHQHLGRGSSQSSSQYDPPYLSMLG